MNYATTLSIQSQVYPDIRFTIRRGIQRIRQQIQMDLMESTIESRSLLNDAILIEEQQKQDKDNKELSSKLDQIYFKMQVIASTKYHPVWMKAMLLKVEGLEIDEHPATPAMIGDAPPELYSEIIRAIQKELGMLGEEEKNLSSDTGSNAQEVGINPSSTVTGAEKTESTVSETAAAISQS